MIVIFMWRISKMMSNISNLMFYISLLICENRKKLTFLIILIYCSMTITMEQMIYTAATFRNTNVGEVARSIGMSPSNLYRKIKHNTLKPWELSKIGEALGAEFVFYFAFPNGSKIGSLEKPKHRKKRKL